LNKINNILKIKSKPHKVTIHMKKQALTSLIITLSFFRALNAILSLEERMFMGDLSPFNATHFLENLEKKPEIYGESLLYGIPYAEIIHQLRVASYVQSFNIDQAYRMLANTLHEVPDALHNLIENDPQGLQEYIKGTIDKHYGILLDHIARGYAFIPEHLYHQKPHENIPAHGSPEEQFIENPNPREFLRYIGMINYGISPIHALPYSIIAQSLEAQKNKKYIIAGSNPYKHCIHELQHYIDNTRKVLRPGIFKKTITPTDIRTIRQEIKNILDLCYTRLHYANDQLEQDWEIVY